MEERRRFSAAPVNFDRFVALNRSHSRSLSPDHELHQMLRPFHQHRTAQPSASASASSSTHHGGQKRAASSAAHGARSARVPRKEGLVTDREKEERRSADLVVCPSLLHTSRDVKGTGDVLATQAATPPSRSTSGCAATTSSDASAEEEGVHHGAPPIAPSSFYTVVTDDSVEVERSQSFAEEVDVLLRAAQQLGSPLYNPVSRRFLCWDLHELEKRSRASYGDTEGVSCDFCGHTDWLDAVATAGSSPTESNGEVKAEPQSSDSRPQQICFFYHCPTCGVDICGPCLEEVRADWRLHVPCMQCHRCGGFETRQMAPLHQCHTPSAKREVKPEVKLLSVAPLTLKMEEESETVPLDRAPSLTRQTPAATVYPGVAMRSHVRLGLPRTRAPAVVVDGARAPQEPAKPAAAVVVEDSGRPHDISPSPERVPPAPPPRRQPNPRRSTVNVNPTVADGPAAPVAAADVDDVRPSAAVVTPKRQQRRPPQGAMPSRGRAAAPQATRTAVAAFEAQQEMLHAAVLATARYEVHLSMRTGEEAEEVRRMVGEQQLLCLPPPAVGQVSVAYFPTRLAAEACAERAAASTITAVLKRCVHGS